MNIDNIDAEGYRKNVGIIICNSNSQLLLAGRIANKGWQFPQGGVHQNEATDEAMYRELYEEVGLVEKNVEFLGKTDRWLKYQLPKKFIRRDNQPLCIGQKQKWYLLKLIDNDTKISLNQGPEPEFDRWKWVSFWEPVSKVIYFKRQIYYSALEELAKYIFPNKAPEKPRWWPKEWQEKNDLEA